MTKSKCPSSRVASHCLGAGALLAALCLVFAPGCSSRPLSVQAERLEREKSASASARLSLEAEKHIQQREFREAAPLLEMAALLDPGNRDIRGRWTEVTRILNRRPAVWDDYAFWEDPDLVGTETLLEVLICFEDGFQFLKAHRYADAETRFRTAVGILKSARDSDGREDRLEEAKALAAKAARLDRMSREPGTGRESR